MPISQQITPNGSDRFTTRIGLEPHAPEVGGYAVYVVVVALEHDAVEKPLKIGKAVLIVPLNTAGATAADYSQYLLLDDPTAEADPCYEANRALLRRAAAEDGAAVPAKLAQTALQ